MIALFKTGTYYLMHVMVAMGVTYAVTRDWKVATAISMMEPFVQTLFFSLHEWAWRPWARVRLIPLKTGTYYLLHVLVTMGITFVITWDWRAAIAISMLEPLVQTLFFCLHELLWQGRIQQSLSAPCCAAGRHENRHL